MNALTQMDHGTASVEALSEGGIALIFLTSVTPRMTLAKMEPSVSTNVTFSTLATNETRRSWLNASANLVRILTKERSKIAALIG